MFLTKGQNILNLYNRIAHPRSTYLPRQLSVASHSGLPHLDGDAFGRFAHTFLGLFYLIQTTMQVSARLSPPRTLPGINAERRKRASSFNDLISLRMRSSAIVNSRLSLPLERSTYLLLSGSDLIFRQRFPRALYNVRHVSAAFPKGKKERKKKRDWIAPSRKRTIYILQRLPRESEEKIQ